MAGEGSTVPAVNIRAVAAAAGVSKTTVSHVLSGKRPVATSTREHVLQVIADLEFRPNFFARALNTQRSQSIALLAQDITNPFYPALARGIQHALTDGDPVLMLFDVGAGADHLAICIEVILQRRVDGVILAVGDQEDALGTLQGAGLPCVVVGQTSPSADLDWVSADDEEIGADAVRHLHERGHRRIALVNGPSLVAPGAPRRRGYSAAMREFGLNHEPSLEQDADWTRDGGCAAMGRLLALADPPTAVFCANDLMAIGALDAAFARGLRVPEDLAVLGVDDIDAAGLVRPALSTIRIEAHEIGRQAAGLLRRRLCGEGPTQPERLLIPHRLIIRGST